jgi:hypothetical protein
MNFENEIKELSNALLADVREPDITGFVHQLFRVAADSNAVACVTDGSPFGGTILGVNGIMLPMPGPLAPREPLCLDSDGLRTGKRNTAVSPAD